MFEWRCYALSASEAIFRTRAYSAQLMQSGDDDYLMNETRRKPSTGTRCHTLMISGMGSFICPAPYGLYLASHGPLEGKSKCSGTRQIRTTDLSVHSQTRQAPAHDDRPKSEDQLYPGSSTVGDLLPVRRIVCENSPATCRPSCRGPNEEWSIGVTNVTLLDRQLPSAINAQNLIVYPNY